MQNKQLIQGLGLGLRPASELGAPQRRASVPFSKNDEPVKVPDRAGSDAIVAAVRRGDVPFLRQQMPLYVATTEGRDFWVKTMTEGLRPALAAGNMDLFESLGCLGADPDVNPSPLVHGALAGNLMDFANDLVGGSDVALFEKAFKARLSPNASPADTKFREYLLSHPTTAAEAKRWKAEGSLTKP